jgi:hypothetical protein
MKKIFFICLIVLVAACERPAQNVDPPVIESKLVLFSFLSPENEAIIAQVSRSKPIYTKGSKQPLAYITNAMVTITNDGGQSATLIYQDSIEGYTLDATRFPIEPGRTYTVKASVDGKIVSGKCTVPLQAISFNDITYRKLNSAGNGSSPSLIFSYKWNDDGQQQNYYRTTLGSTFSYFDGFDTTDYYGEICTNLWSDKNNNGNSISGTCESYSYYDELDSAKVDAILLTTDVHYYEYHLRRLNYFGEDPFSEPTQQYNNVENGLGVVCAFRKSKKTVIVQ